MKNFCKILIIFCIIIMTILTSVVVVKSLNNCTAKTDAIIVDSIIIDNPEGDSSGYAPIYEYEVNGEKFRFSSKIIVSSIDKKPTHLYGTKMPIKYNPNNPKEISYKTSTIRIVFALVVMFVLLFLTIIMIIGKRWTQ